ncbi:MAG: RNA polymerase sigma factor [Planctomycetes bacterium]|nr:RNA polymerase sigma factor [Planctomycetota bacterium]
MGAGAERLEDAALARRAARGAPAAFEALVARHSPGAWRAARAVLGDDHAAQDAVQQAFLRAWRGLGGFQGRSAFGTWLHRIAVNTALNMRRASARRPLERPGEAVLAALEAPAAGSEAAAEAADELGEALARLPGYYREVVMLRDLDALDCARIAERLGLPARTVETRLTRGRRFLRAALGRLRDGESSEG